MTNINLETCPKCAQLKNIHKRFHFERALSAYKYENPLKNIIHLFKYSGYSGLGKYLGTMLFNFIENYHIPTHIFDLLIPMPLSSRKLREREFNQSLVLANELSRLINIPVLNDTLVRNKDTKSQASLTTSERLKNVENAFSLSHPEKVAKKSILLIDDVITTASTANAASLSLKEAGCGQLFVLTLARSYI